MKLQQHKVLKLIYVIFWEKPDFCGKGLVLNFLGQKGPKWAQNEVFKFYEKAIHGVIEKFIMKYNSKNKYLKFL